MTNDSEPARNGGNTAQPPPSAYIPALPAPRMFPSGPPPLLDLTSLPVSVRDALTDDIDLAAVGAVEFVAGAVALWRAWRQAPPARGGDQPDRLYLLEADLPAPDLPGVAGGVRRALEEAGLPDPRVEHYPTGAQLSPDLRRIRGSSALLWTAEPGSPIEVARVFDREDPVTGHGFDETHPLVDAAERDRVAGYLDAGSSLLVTTGRSLDVVTPERGEVVPLSFATDGRWIWTDTVTYYLREYGLSPDPDLLAHVRARRYDLPPVDVVAEHRALAHLYRPWLTVK